MELLEDLHRFRAILANNTAKSVNVISVLQEKVRGQALNSQVFAPDNTADSCTAFHSRSAREIWERLQLFDVLVCTESVSAPAVKRVPDLLLNTLS